MVTPGTLNAVFQVRVLVREQKRRFTLSGL